MKPFRVFDEEEMATLFAESPGTRAVLVKKEKRKRTSLIMQFADAHMALDWCEANRAAFVYLPPRDLRGN